MASRSAVLLSLALGASLLACEIGGGDELAEGSESDANAGECTQVERLQPLFEVSVDGASEVPTLSASCVVAAAGLDGDSWELSMSCEDAEAGSYEIVISSSAEYAPAGVEVGAELTLGLVEDGTFELGSGPELLLEDADGPLLAQLTYSYGGATWGPISVGYASYCEPDVEEYYATGWGFVRASVEGESHDVLVGEPQLIESGDHSYELHALDATDTCCHGSQIDAAMIRR